MRFRNVTVFLAFACAAAAQENGPIGVLRGNLVAWTGTPRIGTLEFNSSGGRLLQCSYDDKTWFERENQRIGVSGMAVGERIEVVADRNPPSPACYARTVQVINTRVPLRTAAGNPRLLSSSVTDSFAPRGDITIAGVVLGIDGNSLRLRTRNDGPRTVLLRADTRYLGDGLPLNRESLPRQTIVFVRAGRNLDGDVEAYQVIWGQILRTDQ